MHHNTAVRRLRTIAEDCDRVGSLFDGEDGLVAVYAFGPVLDQPGQELEAVNILLVLGLSAAELPWGVEPPGCTSLAHLLRLDKAPVLRRWRPAEWPVANHEIRRPMPIWSREDGVHMAALMLWPSEVPSRSGLRILMTTSWLSRFLASSKRRRLTFAPSGIATGTTSTGGVRIAVTAASPRSTSGKPSTAISICSTLRRRFTPRCDCPDRRGTVASPMWAC